jgi:hypothetical protein
VRVSGDKCRLLADAVQCFQAERFSRRRHTPQGSQDGTIARVVVALEGVGFRSGSRCRSIPPGGSARDGYCCTVCGCQQFAYPIDEDNRALHRLPGESDQPGGLPAAPSARTVRDTSPDPVG